MSETLNIRFPDEMSEWLGKEAERRDRSKGYLVKEYVAEKMPKQAKRAAPPKAAKSK